MPGLATSLQARSARPTARSAGRSLAVMVIVVAAGGCGVEGPDESLDVEQLGQPIVNAQADGQHPAVVRIHSGQELCSGTLVGYQTVLTAAHCVVPNAQTQVDLGGEPATSATYPVVTATVHPQFDPVSLDNDVAVLRLGEVPAVSPTPISRTTPGVAAKVTIVGFGMTGDGANDQGVKRVATTRILWVDDGRISLVPTLGIFGGFCFGDSGGPTFVAAPSGEVQVGIHSMFRVDTAPDATLIDQLAPYSKYGCSARGFDVRIEPYVDWIVLAAQHDVFVQGDPPPARPVASTSSSGSAPEQAAPRVVITAPASGSHLASGIRMTVEASITPVSAPIAGADVFVNGARAGSTQQPPWSFAVTVPAGLITIEVRAIDSAGQTGSGTTEVTAGVSSSPTSASASETIPPPGTSDGMLGPAERGGGGCSLAAGDNTAAAPAMALLWVLLLFAARLRRQHRLRSPV